MYESFKNAKMLAILLIVIGFLFFVYELIPTFSISLFGITTLIIGFSILSVILAAREEIDKLRVENIELRKKLESK